MASYIDQRKSTRYNTEGTITLYSTIMSIKDTNADLLDFSGEGIRFSTAKRMAPGTTIFFKSSSKNYLPTDEVADSQVKSMGLVTVKWCRNRSKEEQFEVGANYVLPY